MNNLITAIEAKAMASKATTASEEDMLDYIAGRINTAASKGQHSFLLEALIPYGVRLKLEAKGYKILEERKLVSKTTLISWE